jgi:hypothetical protein
MQWFASKFLSWTIVSMGQFHLVNVEVMYDTSFFLWVQTNRMVTFDTFLKIITIYKQNYHMGTILKNLYEMPKSKKWFILVFSNQNTLFPSGARR